MGTHDLIAGPVSTGTFSVRPPGTPLDDVPEPVPVPGPCPMVTGNERFTVLVMEGSHC